MYHQSVILIFDEGLSPFEWASALDPFSMPTNHNNNSPYIYYSWNHSHSNLLRISLSPAKMRRRKCRSERNENHNENTDLTLNNAEWKHITIRVHDGSGGDGGVFRTNFVWTWKNTHMGFVPSFTFLASSLFFCTTRFARMLFVVVCAVAESCAEQSGKEPHVNTKTQLNTKKLCKI